MTKEKDFPNTTRISFMVERSLDKEIEKFAFVNEITKSDILRAAITDFLEREKKKKKK